MSKVKTVLPCCTGATRGSERTRGTEVAGKVTGIAGQSCPAGMTAEQKGKTRSAAGTANKTAEGHSHETAGGQPQGIGKGHAEPQIGKDEGPERGPDLLTRPETNTRTKTNHLAKTKSRERRPPRSEGNLHQAAPVAAVAVVAVAVTASLTVRRRDARKKRRRRVQLRLKQRPSIL